jgi:hypothetical protein
VQRSLWAKGNALAYFGYFGIGSMDIGGTPVVELVNSDRAFTYGEGLQWLSACDDCDNLEYLFGDTGYDTVAGDPAPWYDADNADSESFLGVVGLEASGIDDSTSTATTYQAAGVGGIAGALRFNTRTVVIRALAIAKNECGLGYGLSWLRNLYSLELDPCSGDGFYFLDCCPSCDDFEPGETKDWCWPGDYDSMLYGLPFMNNLYPYRCDDEWWPSTYEELSEGPPRNDPYWCNWPETYGRVQVGPPRYPCTADECILKYVRMFRNARVIEGPIVLNKQSMSDGSAIAEIEFSVVAADPTHYNAQTGLPTGSLQSAAEIEKAGGINTLQKVFAL